MGRRRDRSKFAAGIDKSLLHFGEFETEQGEAGGQHKVEAGREERLMAAIDFAEAALGPVAVDGITHGSPGGNDPHAGGSGGRARGTQSPGQEKSPAVSAAALLTNGAEVVVAPKPLHGAQVHLKQP
jgi:hypothetical protein